MNKYYVYIHYRLTDGTPFYVGKGHARRAWSESKRNTYWKNTKKKHGLKVEIIFDNLTEEESFQCEIDTILEMKYFGHKLVNMTNGGEGFSGGRHTVDSKLKISNAHKGKKLSNTRIQQLSELHKGKKLSSEHKKKLSNAKLGKVAPNKGCKQPTTSSDKNPAADLNVYKFIRADGEIHIGTRYSLCQKYNLPLDKIGKLFYKIPRNKVRDWKLDKEYLNDSPKS